jgi:3-(methylthio)propanoyl-CoA dehydrogenase
MICFAKRKELTAKESIPFVAGGWNGLTFPAEFGGQGYRSSWQARSWKWTMSANLGFSLCSVTAPRSPPREEWVGCTESAVSTSPGRGKLDRYDEPHRAASGSDLGLVRTRAVPEGDHFHQYGQKIFITHGEHNMAENIV